MVRAGCVFVAGIHPSRTWTSGSFESMRWNACMHRLDLGLYSHPKEFFWGMEFEPMLTPREKSPLPENVPRGVSNPRHFGSEPKHYQLSYSGPGLNLETFNRKLRVKAQVDIGLGLILYEEVSSCVGIRGTCHITSDPTLSSSLLTSDGIETGSINDTCDGFSRLTHWCCWHWSQCNAAARGNHWPSPRPD